MSYVSEQLELLKKKNSNEPEFIQAATEVLTSLEPVFEQNPNGSLIKGAAVVNLANAEANSGLTIDSAVKTALATVIFE